MLGVPLGPQWGGRTLSHVVDPCSSSYDRFRRCVDSLSILCSAIGDVQIVTSFSRRVFLCAERWQVRVTSSYLLRAGVSALARDGAVAALSCC